MRSPASNPPPYLRENAAAIVRSYPVAANSRFTVDTSADPELVGSSFGMHVTFDQPGVAERSMYFGLDPFCVDLEYLLLSLPPSPWGITVEAEDASTSLGEDLGADKSPESRGGTTRVGKFTGRRRL